MSASVKRYTTRDCWELEQKVDAALDVELDKLLAIDDPKRRASKREHGLYRRLVDAGAWLSMIQRAVVTDDAVINLPAGVSVALWDAHIL